MKFQLRRFLVSVRWGDWSIVLAALLSVMVLLYAADQRGKSKKNRCPTCNQIVKEAK